MGEAASLRKILVPAFKVEFYFIKFISDIKLFFKSSC